MPNIQYGFDIDDLVQIYKDIRQGKPTTSITSIGYDEVRNAIDILTRSQGNDLGRRFDATRSLADFRNALDYAARLNQIPKINWKAQAKTDVPSYTGGGRGSGGLVIPEPPINHDFINVNALSGDLKALQRSFEGMATVFHKKNWHEMRNWANQVVKKLQKQSDAAKTYQDSLSGSSGGAVGGGAPAPDLSGMLGAFIGAMMAGGGGGGGITQQDFDDMVNKSKTFNLISAIRSKSIPIGEVFMGYDTSGGNNDMLLAELPATGLGTPPILANTYFIGVGSGSDFDDFQKCWDELKKLNGVDIDLDESGAGANLLSWIIK